MYEGSEDALSQHGCQIYVFRAVEYAPPRVQLNHLGWASSAPHIQWMERCSMFNRLRSQKVDKETLEEEFKRESLRQTQWSFNADMCVIAASLIVSLIGTIGIIQGKLPVASLAVISGGLAGARIQHTRSRRDKDE